MTTQRWPITWLLTDEQMGERLWPALDCAGDHGAGVILRHHSTDPDRRALIGRRVADLAQRRGLVLGVARDSMLARELGARFVHNPDGPSLGLPISRSVHDEGEAQAAASDGAALVFVSPVYPTNSHPGAPALGEKPAARLAAMAGVPAFALGGVGERQWRKLKTLGFAGWAAIDWWLEQADRRFRL